MTYLSAFIRVDEYGATATVQITSLLAAIALYFSLDKPLTEYTTLSDGIFISVFIAILLMFTLTVFRDHSVRAGRLKLSRLLTAGQLYLFPLGITNGIMYSIYHTN